MKACLSTACACAQGKHTEWGIFNDSCLSICLSWLWESVNSVLALPSATSIFCREEPEPRDTLRERQKGESKECGEKNYRTEAYRLTADSETSRHWLWTWSWAEDRPGWARDEEKKWILAWSTWSVFESSLKTHKAAEKQNVQSDCSWLLWEENKKTITSFVRRFWKFARIRSDYDSWNACTSSLCDVDVKAFWCLPADKNGIDLWCDLGRHNRASPEHLDNWKILMISHHLVKRKDGKADFAPLLEYRSQENEARQPKRIEPMEPKVSSAVPSLSRSCKPQRFYRPERDAASLAVHVLSHR